MTTGIEDTVLSVRSRRGYNLPKINKSSCGFSLGKRMGYGVLHMYGFSPANQLGYSEILGWCKLSQRRLAAAACTHVAVRGSKESFRYNTEQC